MNMYQNKLRRKIFLPLWKQLSSSGVSKMYYHYHEMVKPPVDKPIPWRYLTISCPKKAEFVPQIQVGIYNKWASLIPPAPILFLHGFKGNHKHFSSLIRTCNYPYGIACMDLRSQGGSGKSQQLSLHLHARDVLRVINGLRVNFCHIVGFEFGGYVALKAALTDASKVGSIVLINSGAPYEILSEEPVKTNLKQYLLSTPKQEANQPNEISDLTLDEKERLKYDYKTIDGVKFARAGKDTISQNLHQLYKQMIVIDDLLSLHHPVTIIHSEFGYQKGSPNDFYNDRIEKFYKERTLVKGIHKISGATHESLLTDPKNASQLMKIVEGHVETYDIHRQVENKLKAIRTPEENTEVHKKWYERGSLHHFIS